MKLPSPSFIKINFSHAPPAISISPSPSKSHETTTSDRTLSFAFLSSVDVKFPFPSFTSKHKEVTFVLGRGALPIRSISPSPSKSHETKSVILIELMLCIQDRSCGFLYSCSPCSSTNPVSVPLKVPAPSPTALAGAVRVPRWIVKERIAQSVEIPAFAGMTFDVGVTGLVGLGVTALPSLSKYSTVAPAERWDWRSSGSRQTPSGSVSEIVVFSALAFPMLL